MPDDFLLRYFSAEKAEALLFLALGPCAIVGAWLLYRHSARYKGSIVPLVAIAAIQIVVGATVFLRTDAQVVDLQRKFHHAPAQFKAEESQRMTLVMTSFGRYKILEMALLVLGVGLAAGLRRRRTWHAFGIGLALQAAIMLGLDWVAESRGQRYLDAVLQL